MRKWLPLVTVCMGSFMLLVDVTIVNVALPDMARSLHSSFAALQWVVDAYALVLAALLLGAGSLADRVGHRRAYVAGLAIFATASLACGLAPDPGALIAARAVQGVGAAAMFATTFALLNSSYSGRDRGVAYGMWGAVGGASTAVGPVLGGVLTQGLSWRWIFFVNLPVSVAAIVLCLTVLTDAHAPRGGRLDLPGMAAFTGAAGLSTYALIRANEHGWSEPLVWVLLGVALASLAIFVAVEARSKQPMFDLSLLRNRSFTGVLVGSLLLSFAAFSAFVYTSIWVQSVLGLSPIQAGLIGLPMSLMAFAVSASVGRFLHHSRPGLVIGSGLLFIGAGGLISALLLHGSAGWAALLPGFAVSGIGVGLATPTMASAAMAMVPPQRGGMAAGAVNTLRQLGFALGVAALGSVFAARAAAHLSAAAVPGSGRLARAVAGGQTPVVLAHLAPAQRAGLADAIAPAALAGVRATMAVSGAVGVLAGVVVLCLMRAPRSGAAPARAGAEAALAGR